MEKTLLLKMMTMTQFITALYNISKAAGNLPSAFDMQAVLFQFQL